MANIQNVSKMTSDTIQNFMTDLKFDCLTITLLNVYFHDPEVRKIKFQWILFYVLEILIIRISFWASDLSQIFFCPLIKKTILEVS